MIKRITTTAAAVMLAACSFFVGSSPTSADHVRTFALRSPTAVTRCGPNNWSSGCLRYVYSSTVYVYCRAFSTTLNTHVYYVQVKNSSGSVSMYGYVRFYSLITNVGAPANSC